MTIKELIRSVIFLTIFGIILISLTYMLRTNGEVKDIFTGFYAEEDNSLDVVMIGSSPVYPFYAAPQLWGEHGITSFPLSSHVQRPSATLPLLKEARKTQTPAVVVFEMRMFTMADGRMEDNMAYARGVTDNMKYSWNRIEAINRLVTDSNERYTYYFDIFKYHSNWKTLVLPEQIASVIYERNSPMKGFVIKDEVGPLAVEEVSDWSAVTATAPIPAEQEMRLRELLDYLKENEQQALFIVSPYRLAISDQKMYNYMTDIIEASGYRLINFNNHYEEIGIDFATDYYDYGSHVNTLGAGKCTAFLGDQLSRYFDLPDRRAGGLSAETYQSWEEAYDRYQGEVTGAVERIERSISEGDFAERPEN
jgi:hypothetical protein